MTAFFSDPRRPGSPVAIDTVQEPVTIGMVKECVDVPLQKLGTQQKTMCEVVSHQLAQNGALQNNLINLKKGVQTVSTACRAINEILHPEMAQEEQNSEEHHIAPSNFSRIG